VPKTLLCTTTPGDPGDDRARERSDSRGNYVGVRLAGTQRAGLPVNG
jgi:hypothetical protein